MEFFYSLIWGQFLKDVLFVMATKWQNIKNNELILYSDSSSKNNASLSLHILLFVNCYLLNPYFQLSKVHGEHEKLWSLGSIWSKWFYFSSLWFLVIIKFKRNCERCVCTTRGMCPSEFIFISDKTMTVDRSPKLFSTCRLFFWRGVVDMYCRGERSTYIGIFGRFSRLSNRTFWVVT